MNNENGLSRNSVGILQSLKKHLSAEKKYLAAVSGGADSMALAEGLRLAGFDFAVGHVEHGFRGQASLDDALYVEDWCRKNNIEFHISYVKPAELSRKEGISEEDAARRLRYEALYKMAESVNADYILTAHQADDQAETFLFRLLRGSGSRGLGAIRMRRLMLIRPLLEHSCRDLRGFCRECGIKWREDVTNDDTRYTRNKIRHLLLPFLAENFNPDIKNTLCRTALHIQADTDFLDEMAEEKYRECLIEPGVLDVRDEIFKKEALRIRILQKFWWDFAGEKAEEIAAVNLEDLSRLILEKSSGKKIMLPGGWQGVYAYGKLRLLSMAEADFIKKKALDVREKVRASEQLFLWSDLEKKEQSCPVNEGKTVKIRILSEAELEDFRKNISGEINCKTSVCIYPLEEAKKWGKGLELRLRRPGDRIYPKGGRGHKKLKKYFIDSKIPALQRNLQVVLAVGSEVIWLPGIIAAEPVKTATGTDKTEKWLVFTLI